MPYSVHIVPRDAVSTADEASLRRLFDDEYLHEFGPWHTRHLVASTRCATIRLLREGTVG